MEHIRSLLLAAGIALIAGLLLPEEKGPLRRITEFGISLFLLCILCRPLAAIDGLRWALDDLRLPDDLQYEAETDPTLLKEMGKAVEQGIAEDLAARYGVSAACFVPQVSLSFSDDELVIHSLGLRVKGAGRFLDLYAVREYAAHAYQTNCEVIVDEG